MVHVDDNCRYFLSLFLDILSAFFLFFRQNSVFFSFHWTWRLHIHNYTRKYQSKPMRGIYTIASYEYVGSCNVFVLFNAVVINKPHHQYCKWMVRKVREHYHLWRVMEQNLTYFLLVCTEIVQMDNNNKMIATKPKNPNSRNTAANDQNVNAMNKYWSLPFDIFFFLSFF